MKHKIILILIITCIVISAGVLIGETSNTHKAQPDIVEINRIKVNVQNCNDFSDFDASLKYDFTVVSIRDGTIVFSTKTTEPISLVERLNQAITNYDTVIDYEIDGHIDGKIIIYTGQALKGNHVLRIVAIIAPFTVLCVLLTLYYLYMRFYLYRPFKKLKAFASEVAAGNLDFPLAMDKDNLFGEFTGSFDLLRSELKEARLKAVMEEKSKKELIATLSHDIRTPVSIIRVASELLQISETDNKKLANIKAIQAKTAEIDRLISDLFSSALEDLSELRINVQDIESSQIVNIIHDADPLVKVSEITDVPNCMIKADILRLSQIFGNLISNSYKYAGTKIDVSVTIIDNYVKISFKDYGTSLNKDELPMLENKFYRGTNAEGKDGVGLGLYICSKLLERMGGSLDIDLDSDGFRADISLSLS